MGRGREKNIVYISDRLEPRYRKVTDVLRLILENHNIPLRAIRGTKDIWCRDYMPIQVGRKEFVWFRYAPGYLRGDEHLITKPGDIEPIPEIERCAHSDIVMDGGNLVCRGTWCIVTEKAFSENSGLGREKLASKLRALLRVDHLVVIPSEPDDPLGHADGVVQFADERTVAVNDYSEVDPGYREQLTSALRQAGLRWFEIPYVPKDEWVGDIPPAFGCYVNFLRVGSLLVLPSYGIAEDEQALRVMEKNVPIAAISQVDCRAPSMKGGSLHCVTWDVAVYPAVRPPNRG